MSVKASAPAAPKEVIKEDPAPVKKKVRVEKLGGGDEQQELVNYAYERCGKDCVLTFQAESGWRKDIVSRPNSNGTRDTGLCQMNEQYHSEYVYGVDYKTLKAQRQSVKDFAYIKGVTKNGKTYTFRGVVYNKDTAITAHENAIKVLENTQTFTDSFNDPYNQLDRCIGIWHDAIKKGRIKTTFYGYNVRNTAGVLKTMVFHNE